MAASVPVPGPALDFAGLFAGLPTAYLVLDLDLVIREANAAYLELLGRSREELVGRWAFDAFPPTPEALDEQGRNPLQTSFETARATGRPVAMPLYKYDVLDPATGQVVERYWSLISAPLLDADGAVVLLLQRVEDVTDYVREREGHRARFELGRERVQAVEADLFARVQELHAAQEARDVAARRLASLNEVALALTAVDSVEDLEQIVIGRGMGVLGADGGAIVSVADAAEAEPAGGGNTPDRHHQDWRVTVSEVIGEHVQAKYGRVPHDSPLPACASARTGRRIELPTVADGLAYPGMEAVYGETGRLAWVFLPLTVEGEHLGCLAVSWVHERRLLGEELDLLEGFAAQCAQALSRIQARAAERRAAAGHRRMSEVLQRALLTAPVQPDHLQVAVRYVPALDQVQVGGDWYDAFVTGAGATSLVIGDVAGHDRDAAASMGQVRNLLRGIGYAIGEPPAQVLAQLDRALGDLGMNALVTVVLAQVEQVGHAQGPRVLRWSNAGHPPPLLVHPDGTAELLSADPDLLLGLDAGSPRVDHQVVLHPGDTVLLYTDGLVERRGASLEDGLAWLTRSAGELAPLDLEEFCDRLLAAVGDVEDDVALLAVRAQPQGSCAAGLRQTSR